MERIYSNVSLRFIMNNINMGLIDYSPSIDTLHIINENNKENILIKMIEVNIMSTVSKMIENSTISQAEVTLFDFVVFKTILDPDTNKQMLLVTSLLEMISIDKIIENPEEAEAIKENNKTPTGLKHSIPKKISNWDLDLPQWSLLKIG